MIQQPRAPCGQADADVCQHCAGDCPASGCPVYWRTGVCAVCLGEWGAWRAVVDEVLDHFLVLIDVSAHCGDRIVAGVHLDLAEPARFAAAGWLP